MKTFVIQGNYVVSFRVTPGSVDTIIHDKEFSRSAPVGVMIPNWAHAALDEIYELNQQIETLKEAVSKSQIVINHTEAAGIPYVDIPLPD